MLYVLKIYENNHIEPPWSYIFVFALDALMVLVLAFCVREMLRARRAAVEAEAIVRPKAPLFEGARFVAGTVEYAQGETEAVRVTVSQEGSERVYKNETTHTWTEVERETRARPFYLRHGSGARVRIEPPDGVLLVDKLDQKEWLEPRRRRLRAELLPGEWAVVEGRLHKGHEPEAEREGLGYRHAGSIGWTMKPAPQWGMHVSTESLSRRHELRAQAFRRACLWVVLLAALMNVPLATFRARMLLGDSVVATYAGKTTYTTTSKGKETTHYAVQVKYELSPGERRFARLDVDRDDYAPLLDQVGQIWLRRVPLFSRATALGQGSSVSSFLWGFAAVIAGLAVYRAHRTHTYRRWYEGHVVENGKGQLPLPTYERFLSDTPAVLEARRAQGPSRAASHVEPISME